MTFDSFGAHTFQHNDVLNKPHVCMYLLFAKWTTKNNTDRKYNTHKYEYIICLMTTALNIWDCSLIHISYFGNIGKTFGMSSNIPSYYVQWCIYMCCVSSKHGSSHYSARLYVSWITVHLSYIFIEVILNNIGSWTFTNLHHRVTE